MNTNQTTERSFSIENGPNKDRLFDSCKYAYDGQVNLPVDFKVALAYTAPKDDPGCCYVLMPITDVSITSIEHEDGSGDKFNLRGYCEADLEITSGSPHYRSYEFKAFYNSKSRKGYISFSK